MLEQPVYDFPLVHDPTKDDRFIGGTPQEIPEQIDNVAGHHGLCLLIDKKWLHIPAPIAVQKNGRLHLL